MAKYRDLNTASYEDAVRQLEPGEELVVTNVTSGNPQAGHIPVTSERTYETFAGSGTVHARSKDTGGSS